MRRAAAPQGAAPWPAALKATAAWTATTLLFGCAAAGILGDAPSDVSFRGNLMAYSVAGKVRVQVDGESNSGNFLFARDDQGFALSLWGPLGLGRQNYLGEWEHPGRLYARDRGPDEPRRYLLLSELGLPDAHIFEAFMLCLDDGRREASPRTAGFTTREGWTVRCGDWKSSGRLSLPGTVTASADGDSIRLVLRRWTLGRPRSPERPSY